MKPLAIDIFCGLGGWTEGLLAEGYRVVGFDIERHVYGDKRYPAQLVLQDALTIHGSQFKDAQLIVASPPCQEYSYMAMPWSLAKQREREYLDGTRDVKDLTRLFDACFQIQREACEAAGRHIPMVVENVRGAQKWVGRAKWNFGSFYLWGDVPALMPLTKRAVKVAGLNWSGSDKPGYVAKAFNDTAVARLEEGIKVPGFRFDGSGKSFQTASVEGVKFPVGDAKRTTKGRSAALQHYDQMRDSLEEGIKGFTPDGQPLGKNVLARMHGSRSSARKAASAQIAKIPLVLARHIAHVYRQGFAV